ncbi:MAG: FecR domain-containing protein [Kofleriaceae bacterium]|nr:FecR domain-containing protein [Kofleriaceae bacterium]
MGLARPGRGGRRRGRRRDRGGEPGGAADGLRAALDGEARWAPAPAPRRATPTTTPAPAPALAATATPAATPAPVGIAVVALDDDAAFAHDATAGEDHLVLRRGGLAIDGALAPERTIRVSAEATELRARGARFEARRDRRGLHVVRVFAGSVEIVTGARTVVVRAGETWTLPAPAAADAPATVAPASDGPDASAASTAFRTGWDHLRAGRFAAAAAALEAAAADPGLAEDAAYWAAVAWGRAGDDACARAGLAGFLDDHPASPHAGDAHLALAWLLRDAGDDAAAARHLAAAADDDDPRVRAAARRRPDTLSAWPGAPSCSSCPWQCWRAGRATTTGRRSASRRRPTPASSAPPRAATSTPTRACGGPRRSSSVTSRSPCPAPSSAWSTDRSRRPRSRRTCTRRGAAPTSPACWSSAPCSPTTWSCRHPTSCCAAC